MNFLRLNSILLRENTTVKLLLPGVLPTLQVSPLLEPLGCSGSVNYISAVKAENSPILFQLGLVSRPWRTDFIKDLIKDRINRII